MPIYDENDKFLGVTYEGRMFNPTKFRWELITYYTALSKDYFKA